LAMLPKNLKMVPAAKGVSRKISGGGKPKNSKKDRKIALLILFRRGGVTEKRPKNLKKHRKTALLSLYLSYYICTRYENPGGYGPPCLLLPMSMHAAFLPKCSALRSCDKNKETVTGLYQSQN